MPAKQKVLFISHEATRTGAPLLLLNLIKWMKESEAIEFAILLKREGELGPEFEKLGRTYYFRPPTKNTPRNIVSRLVKALFIVPIYEPFYLKMLKANLKKEKFSLVYSNTIANGEVLEFLEDLDCPIITHIHELQYSIEAFGRENIRKVLEFSDDYIAASESVRMNFVTNYRVRPDKIVQINDFVVNTVKSEKTGRKEILGEFGIPESSFIVGLSGTAEWRKGADLAIQLAFCFKKNNADLPIYFLWVGQFTDSAEKAKIDYDLEKSGLKDRLLFSGAKENAGDYFSAFDLFVLLSREEALGIVGIECAYLGKPVICFENSGGMPEFVEGDAGFVVPYLDIEEVAKRITMLYRQPELGRQLGARGREKVLESYTIEKQGPIFLDTISRYQFTGKDI